MSPNIFNIRVYGLLIDPDLGVLVSDELIRGAYITKFPGGGLEFGEGTRQCLAREFMEETGLTVNIDEHFYTTDFYQQSAFNAAHQIISIYYKVSPVLPKAFQHSDKAFDFSSEKLTAYKISQEIETFRFIPLPQFSPACLTLPIDKIVAQMLLDETAK